MENSINDSLDESLDLRQYLYLFWHWAWLIILAGVVAGAASYFVSKNMTPYYQSSSVVLVNEAPANKGSDYSSVMMSEQLTTTYAQMMVTDPVLSKVEEQLGLNVPLETIKDWITVTPQRDTQLIQVSVETTDAFLSSFIANAIVTTFAEQIQEIQTQRFAQSKVTLETQLADMETEISNYSAQAARTFSTEQKDSLLSKVAQYQEIYANLLLSYEQVRLSEAQAVSSVVQIEPATPDTKQVRPKVLMNTLLAAMLGFLVAAGVIVAREALDDTVKSPEEISRKFKLPVLGVINHHASEPEAPISMTDPRSPTAEAYRTLRTNVSYASVDHPLQTLMIASAEPGEGKSTTIANLAVVLAQSGKNIIAADCDLRHPRLHTYFGLPNRVGMTNLFARPTETLDGFRQPGKQEHLTFITTGALPPNPAELMGSQKMQSILAVMRQSADMVLIDTPPVLAVTDAAALAPSMDGVLLVVRPGKTRASALQQTIEQLHQVNARLLGVVLNDVVTHGKTYGYHYKYYRNYAAYQDYYGGNRTKRK